MEKIQTYMYGLILFNCSNKLSNQNMRDWNIYQEIEKVTFILQEYVKREAMIHICIYQYKVFAKIFALHQ